MPGPGSECSSITVSRKIYIREPAGAENMKDTYLENKTTLIKSINSDNNGFYQVELPAGTYSIFVEDEGKEYCNSFGSYGKACQVTVGSGIKEYNIKIDHAVW